MIVARGFDSGPEGFSMFSCAMNPNFDGDGDGDYNHRHGSKICAHSKQKMQKPGSCGEPDSWGQ